MRSLSPDIPAGEVVKRAKAEGMKLSVGQVYNIRAVARKSGLMDTSAAPRGPGHPQVAASTAPTKRAASNADDVLRKLIADLGLARAREVMNEVQAAFR